MSVWSTAIAQGGMWADVQRWTVLGLLREGRFLWCGRAVRCTREGAVDGKAGKMMRSNPSPLSWNALPSQFSVEPPSTPACPVNPSHSRAQISLPFSVLSSHIAYKSIKKLLTSCLVQYLMTINS